MTDHIIDITYYPNVHQYTARTVYQYDKGWQLKISGLTTNKIIQVQYGIEGMAHTLNVDPEYQENYYIAKIPDVLLTQVKGVVAYVYVADASLGQTVCYIRIPITPREKPADYTYTQEETAGYAQLLAQLTQATKEVEELDKELEIIVDAATTATASANAASQAASNAVAEFENIKQDVSSQISELEERIIELEENPPSALPEDWTPTIDNIEGLSDALSNIVEVSSEEPKDKNTELWVNPDSEELQIPQIDDNNVSAYDTYSSQKIEETVTDLRHDINALADTMALLHAGVPDTSAKAASHELHATDASMYVTLHGATYQAGSGDPTPDNVRPISGVDAALVHVGGKNLIDFPEGQVINYSVLNDTPIKRILNLADGNYILSWGITSSGGTNKIIIVTYADGRTVGGYVDKTQMKLSGAIESVSVINWTGNDQTIDWMQLEAGTVATDYEPYNADVIDITAALNGEALYGDGTTDDIIENDVLVDGERKCKITRNWAHVTVDGSDDENWAYNQTNPSGLFQFYLPYSVPARNGSGICNRFKWNVSSSSSYECAYTYNTSAYIMIKPETIGSPTADQRVSALKTFLSSNPVELVFQRKEPEVYYTDPIELLKPVGLMPVTVTGSGETAVEYSCDTKSYIDRKFDALAAALIGG